MDTDCAVGDVTEESRGRPFDDGCTHKIPARGTGEQGVVSDMYASYMFANVCIIYGSQRTVDRLDYVKWIY